MAAVEENATTRYFNKCVVCRNFEAKNVCRDCPDEGGRRMCDECRRTHTNNAITATHTVVELSKKEREDMTEDELHHVRRKAPGECDRHRGNMIWIACICCRNVMCRVCWNGTTPLCPASYEGLGEHVIRYTDWETTDEERRGDTSDDETDVNARRLLRQQTYETPEELQAASESFIKNLKKSDESCRVNNEAFKEKIRDDMRKTVRFVEAKAARLIEKADASTNAMRRSLQKTMAEVTTTIGGILIRWEETRELKKVNPTLEGISTGLEEGCQRGSAQSDQSAPE